MKHAHVALSVILVFAAPLVGAAVVPAPLVDPLLQAAEEGCEAALRIVGAEDIQVVAPDGGVWPAFLPEPPGQDDVGCSTFPPGAVPYFFGVTIKQDLPSTVPVISGTLMNGCSFQSQTDWGKVTCTPPVPPQPGTYWVCTSPGLIATASTGTVVGTTQCTNGPPVVAVATNPGNPSVWNIDYGVYDFAWTCEADFSSLGATGNVLCDEPDPPVQWWG